MWGGLFFPRGCHRQYYVFWENPTASPAVAAARLDARGGGEESSDEMVRRLSNRRATDNRASDGGRPSALFSRVYQPVRVDCSQVKMVPGPVTDRAPP